MTNRLVIHVPGATITFEIDNQEKLNVLSEFCKKEFNAYHSSENIDELTVDVIDKEMYNKFHSFVFELGLL